MGKKILFVVLALFLLSFVAAHDNYAFKEKISESEYFPHKNKVVTTTTYIDYENEDRFPTYDYRHGYSYRATKEYRDSYKVKFSKNNWGHKSYKKYKKDYDYGKDEYYKYVPHLRSYEKKWCRHEAPRGQLFYIKCPF